MAASTPASATGGKATVDFGGSDTAHTGALQADGKFVVAGTTWLPGGGSQFGLARLNDAGSLDTSFGKGGLVTTNFGLDMDAANGVAIQGDGKIVVAGGSSNAAALARYQADGTPSGSPSQRFVSQ